MTLEHKDPVLWRFEISKVEEVLSLMLMTEMFGLLDALHTGCEGHMCQVLFNCLVCLFTSPFSETLLRPISADCHFHNNALFSGKTLRYSEYIYMP